MQPYYDFDGFYDINDMNFSDLSLEQLNHFNDTEKPNALSLEIHKDPNIDSNNRFILRKVLFDEIYDELNNNRYAINVKPVDFSRTHLRVESYDDTVNYVPRVNVCHKAPLREIEISVGNYTLVFLTRYVSHALAIRYNDKLYHIYDLDYDYCMNNSLTDQYVYISVLYIDEIYDVNLFFQLNESSSEVSTAKRRAFFYVLHRLLRKHVRNFSDIKPDREISRYDRRAIDKRKMFILDQNNYILYKKTKYYIVTSSEQRTTRNLFKYIWAVSNRNLKIVDGFCMPLYQLKLKNDVVEKCERTDSKFDMIRKFIMSI